MDPSYPPLAPSYLDYLRPHRIPPTPASLTTHSSGQSVTYQPYPSPLEVIPDAETPFVPPGSPLNLVTSVETVPAQPAIPSYPTIHPEWYPIEHNNLQGGQQAPTDKMSGEQRTYRITPIQNPSIASALSQYPTVSRIPLSPPLIIQMDCWTHTDTLDIPYSELPFLVCHVSLETPDGEDAMMLRSSDGSTVQNLYGTLVATPSVMLNQVEQTGVYFCFPDISVRSEGSYRLKCALYRITGGGAIDTSYTTTFQAVPNDQYRAADVTALTQHFHDQGVISFGLPKDEW